MCGVNVDIAILCVGKRTQIHHSRFFRVALNGGVRFFRDFFFFLVKVKVFFSMVVEEYGNNLTFQVSPFFFFPVLVGTSRPRHSP